VGVTPSWQRHSFEFVASDTDNEARLSFVIGGEGPRTIWFDNVSLARVSAPGPQPPRACAVCGGDCSRCGGNRTVWVDQRNGKDTNNGLSRGQAVKTIARGARIVRGGDVMVVRPGTYYEKPALRNLGSSAIAPVWIISEFPGEAVISGLWKAAAEGTQSWQSRGNGVYSARHGDAYVGSYNGAFLFHYNSLSDLTRPTVNGVRKPPYGFASDGSTFYLRLPGNANPNGRSVELTDSFRQTLVTIENSPYVILDGFHLSGAGNEEAINIDARSHHVTLRNLLITHSRHAAVLPNDSVVEWSEYSYPHFREFVDDLIELNGESSQSVFDLVKRYYSNAGNAYLEGGIATSPATESLNAEFRYNYIHDVFDGERLGNFSNSVTHHNVYNYNYDDHIELESWRSTHNSRNLRVHDNLFLNGAGAPLSHQDTSSQMRGPHYVYRNVVYQTDRRHAHPAYLIKNRNLARTRPSIYYYHNVLHNVKGTTGWGNINWLYWDNKDGDPQFLTLRNNIVLFDSLTDNGHNEDPDSSHNLLVNDRDNAVVRGRGGKFLGRDAAAVRFNDLQNLDFGLQAASPAVNAGTPLPNAWPDSRRGVGVPDEGAFELGETPGPDWPRPRRTTFTASKPDRWNR
ncbi:MAG: hypothetical protein ACR2RL_00535, partial [Gammaproteobacteria bacterium]